MSFYKFMSIALLGVSSFAHADQVQADAPQATPVITVVATAKVLPGQADAFKEAANAILAPTRAEAGAIGFRYHQSIQDPTEFVFYETWASQAAIDAHMKSPHMLKFFSQVGPIFQAGYPLIKQYYEINE